jgi:hypothetical protein
MSWRNKSRTLTKFERMTLAFIGFPFEIALKIFGGRYETAHKILFIDRHTGRTILIPTNFKFDGFSFAPDLRKKDGTRSDGAPVHDFGWRYGKWDNGDTLTFDQCNDALRQVLLDEDQPKWAVKAYIFVVKRRCLRRKWYKRLGHG